MIHFWELLSPWPCNSYCSSPQGSKCTAKEAHLKDRLSIFVCQLHVLGNQRPCFFTTGGWWKKNLSGKFCPGEERKELDLLCQTGSTWGECNPAANGTGPCSPAQHLSQMPWEGTTHQLAWHEAGKALVASPCLTLSTVHSKRAICPKQLEWQD